MKKHIIVNFLALAIAITMIITGIYRGELSYVFNKAVNICLECIGLG